MSPDRPDPDEEFRTMARQLRAEAEAELTELEYETERAEIKQRDLTARSMLAMMEGERWQVTLGTRAVDGVVVHAGQNYVGLQDRMGNLHDVVHSAIGVIRIVEVDPTAGRAPITFRPATFRARLLSVEQVREVELAGMGGAWSLLGAIDSVNSDHLVLTERNGEVSLVPLASIGYLGRASATGARRRAGAVRR
jgi:hypothetical protein